ncbi:MAG: hypothetical protein H0V70_12485 [Ktedonobacteraceae bacterium]|nr:hypothetical protein [Ktedonobacteraceae bacterium]
MNTPWIITLSLHLYRWLLSIGPATYRAEYEEATIQVFRQCCRDAYRQRGAKSVLFLWLPMFSEAIVGMIAEHFSVLRHAYERIGQMLPTMRRSMISTLCAFIVFGVAYIFLMRVTDPRAPLNAAANGHPAIGLSFAIINWSAEIAFLVVVLGGLPILFSAFKHALSEKRGLALLAIRPRRLLLLIAGTVILEIAFFAFLVIVQFLSGAPASQHTITPAAPVSIAEQLGIVTLFTFVILAIPLFIAQAVLRSEFSPKMLRYALALMSIATLTMTITCLATVIWIISFWILAPDIAASQGLGLAGLRGNIGGSAGVVIVVVMMALAVGVSTFAVRRGLHNRTAATI